MAIPNDGLVTVKVRLLKVQNLKVLFFHKKAS
jgi:hypothetical protein